MLSAGLKKLQEKSSITSRLYNTVGEASQVFKIIRASVH